MVLVANRAMPALIVFRMAFDHRPDETTTSSTGWYGPPAAKSGSGRAEPSPAARIDESRPIHPLPGRPPVPFQRPSGRFFFGRDGCSRLEPREADRLAAFDTHLRVLRC